MYKWVLKIINKVLAILPMKKIILFESNPDYACNTYPVYVEMKNNDFFKDYKFVWLVSNKNDDMETYILKKTNNLFEGMKALYYKNVAECFVACNYILAKRRKKQLSLFLTHGSKTKKTRGVYEVGNAADYVLCQSHFFDEIIRYEYGLQKEQLVYLGFPRCDYFFNLNIDVYDALELSKECKYIVWLPTFRKHAGSSKSHTVSDYEKIGMPIIYDIENLQNFNALLEYLNVYIIYKPHPAQDISALRANTLSHILVINDNWLRDRNLQLYQIIAESAALITDYSSVYFDYLMLNKPIATTTDDAEQWKENRGFAFDLESMYEKSTIRVSNYAELKQFIIGVNNNVDDKKDERNRICQLTNMYTDGNSTKRVVDFIEKKLKGE